MEKIAAALLCFVLVLSFTGCGTKKAGNSVPAVGGDFMPVTEAAETEKTESAVAEGASAAGIDDWPETARMLVSEVILIDEASLDIDNDGIIEECSMICGPTSGLFTLVITASADG